jgi:hypothetical protein
VAQLVGRDFLDGAEQVLNRHVDFDGPNGALGFSFFEDQGWARGAQMSGFEIELSPKMVDFKGEGHFREHLGSGSIA